MTDLFFARAQMAVSLGFHIVFAAVGIGMPLLMVIAEGRWLRTGDAVCLELAKRWARGTAVLFAVGLAPVALVEVVKLVQRWSGFGRGAARRATQLRTEC